MSSISQNLEGCELLSIDIFDTLLIRLVDDPQDLFLSVACVGHERGALPESVSEIEFQRRRVRAQRIARARCRERGGSGEVSLEEIYDCLELEGGDRAGLGEVEFATEVRSCLLNPELVEWVVEARRRSVPVVLASDMYLSGALLRELLGSCGADLDWFSGIYVSCECGGDKESGAVFERILADFPEVDPAAALHVGDRLDADELAAERMGFRSFRYRLESSYLSELLEYEGCYGVGGLGRLRGLRALSERATVACGANTLHGRFGAAILGPLALGFCQRVLRRCEEMGISRVFVFTRESTTLLPVLEAVFSGSGRALEVEELAVSRASTFLARWETWTEEAAEDVLDATGVSVADVFRFLGWSDLPLEFREVADASLRSESGSEVRLRLKRFLMSERRVELLNERILEARRALVGYLEGVFAGASSVAFLDVGFRGTISSNIERALSLVGWRGRIWHGLLFGTRELEGLREDGVNIEGVFCDAGWNEACGNTIRRSSFFLEQLLTGSGGSCLGYDFSEGRWLPVFGEPVGDVSTLQAKEHALAGVLAFQKVWAHAAELKPELGDWTSGERSALAFALERVIKCPLTREAEALGGLLHDFNGASQSACRVISDEDRSRLRVAGSSEAFLDTSLLAGVRWPEGVVAERDQGLLMRRRLNGGVVEDSYLSAFLELCSRAMGEGESRFALYGAGEAGRSLLRAARMLGAEVACFVDRKESLWGREIEGVAVRSLEQAAREWPESAFLVGSFAYAGEIAGTILSVDAAARIYTVNDVENERA